MKKYKGFTLIEILIVLVVIGILSSMMVIASNESTTTAKASTIVSNLRNFSMAAMAYYTDNVDNLPDDIDLTGEVKDYLHNEGKIIDGEKYFVVRDTEKKIWWAKYKLDDKDNDRVREKLSGRAEGANLIGTIGDDTPKKTNDKYPQYQYNSTTQHDCVWLLIRSSKKK